MDENTKKIDIPESLPLELTDKYQVVDNTFIQEVKDNPKDRITVEIGDSKQVDFKPQAKIMRWDNEVNFSLRAEEHPDAVVETDGKIIKYITPEYEVHQYDLDPGAIGEDGGLEFEWLLPSKPSTNVLQATIQTKGLKFLYQPALTQKEIDEGANRPENVEGSYAVYHDTKGGMNRAGGMEYKVGKAFHIYRPKVTDADGSEIWGELNVDIDTGILSVTIDQTYLDKAIYPVLVDPTFGYTSVGGTTSDSSSSGDYYGSKFTSSEDGSVYRLHAYSVLGWRGGTDQNSDHKMGIYLSSTRAKIQESNQIARDTGNTTYDWRFFTLSTPATITSSTEYTLLIVFEADSYEPAFDTDASTIGVDEVSTWAGENASMIATHEAFSTTRKYSMYATYLTSSSPSGPTLCTFRPYNNEPPTSNYATLDIRNGHPCLDFDASTDEAAVFSGVLPRSYGGGGITVYLHYSMTSGSTGNVVLTAAFERIGDGSQDIDSDGFATANSGTFLVINSSSYSVIESLNFTDGAEIDSLAAGEKFRLKVTRDADNASDTTTGDLELLGIELRETS